MALKIRLARAGAKKRPYYHIVVADSRSPRDGRFIEKIGSYNPMLPRESNERVKLKEDRIKHWLGVGAKPTERVELFLGTAKIIPMPVQSNRPQQSQPKAKAQERLREKEEAATAAIQAAKDAKKAAEEAEKQAAEEAAAPETEAPQETASPEEVSPENASAAEEASE